jgi:hypothetical protein
MLGAAIAARAVAAASARLLATEQIGPRPSAVSSFGPVDGEVRRASAEAEAAASPTRP